MLRMTFTLASIALLCSIPLHAQETLTPEQHLAEARRLLTAMPASQSTAGMALAALQRDFNDFAGSYLSQQTDASRPAPDAQPATTKASAAPPDWRAKYLVVEADLASLIGPANVSAASVMPGIDPNVAAQLQQVRQHLGFFYAATMTARSGNPVPHTGPDDTRAPVAPTVAAPNTPPAVANAAPAAPAANAPGAPAAPAQPASVQPVAADRGTIMSLLERMQTLVDDALSGKPGPARSGAVGTSGLKGESGRVTIDRATLDELRSEIAQIRTMLAR